MDNQDELIANLTTSVTQKDEIIENLEKDIVTSMADSDELRTKLFKSDLDRDLRLARLGLKFWPKMGILFKTSLVKFS